MGQYFLIRNMDKREFLSSYWFGLTSKLPGILRPGDGIMTGFGVLLALSGSGWYSTGLLCGRWAADRIAIIGDYYQGTVADQQINQDTWYEIASQHDGWVNISEHVRQLLEIDWEMCLPAPLVDDGDPRSLLHEDGTITAIPNPAWDNMSDTGGLPERGQEPDP